jgi:hypothetical protein
MLASRLSGRRCWAERGDPRKQHGQQVLPCATLPAVLVLPASTTRSLADAWVAGVQASAGAAVFVEIMVTVSETHSPFAVVATVVLQTRWSSRLRLVVPHKAKHSDETRNAGRAKRLNRIIGAGR